MRLVKKSVNQDDPGTYHLFYADADGNPGTDLTFFPFRNSAPGGWARTRRRDRARDSRGSRLLARRLTQHGAKSRRRDSSRPSRDHARRPARSTRARRDERRAVVSRLGQEPVPADRQILGLHAVRAWERDRHRPRSSSPACSDSPITAKKTAGIASASTAAARASTSSSAKCRTKRAHGASAPCITWPGVSPTTQSTRVRERVEAAKRRPTEVIDRFWFKSVYFLEPGGVLFELATDGPGFTADESLDHLGEQLVLPPWLEPNRQEIEASLPSLATPLSSRA